MVRFWYGERRECFRRLVLLLFVRSVSQEHPCEVPAARALDVVAVILRRALHRSVSVCLSDGPKYQRREVGRLLLAGIEADQRLGHY